MASLASQLIEEVTAHAQSDSLEDARETCADGTYFTNILRTMLKHCFSTVSLTRSHNTLPDDGDHTETCWSYINFNVHFNTLLKKFSFA